MCAGCWGEDGLTEGYAGRQKQSVMLGHGPRFYAACTPPTSTPSSQVRPHPLVGCQPPGMHRGDTKPHSSPNCQD